MFQPENKASDNQEWPQPVVRPHLSVWNPSLITGPMAPLQETGSGLCGKPQARGPDILQQEQPNGFPNLAAICGLPSLANPLHIPQDQRCPGSILDLSQLREEPTTLNVQAHVSVEDRPLQLNSRAMEQAAQRRQLDL